MAAGGMFAFVVLIIAINYLIYSSGSLVESRRFIASSAEIKNKLGEILGSRPEVFKCSLVVTPSTGSAHLVMKVNGSKRSAELFLSLDKVDGIWHVKSAALAGVPVTVPPE
jgi:hypothetical protein